MHGMLMRMAEGNGRSQHVRIWRHRGPLPESLAGAVLALGNFDGFHRGHQVVIGEAGRLARAMGVPLAVLVTEPHPRAFFAPGSPPFRLTPFRDRFQLLEAFGVDLLTVLRFDQALAATPHWAFVRRYLVESLAVRHVVVGFDYRFGRGRGGSAETLAWQGGMEGFGVTIVPPVRFGIEGAAGEIYSSSLVRQALRDGAARRAAALLGHWWTVSGRVIPGDRRGHLIGFPTANIRMRPSALRPRRGVYAVRVVLENGGGEPTVREGVANFGLRPTFAGLAERLEVHLFDFDADLYGRHLRVEFVGFIRPERKFESPQALRTQIVQDCEAARAMLADPENARAHLPAPTLARYLADHPSPPVALREFAGTLGV